MKLNSKDWKAYEVGRIARMRDLRTFEINWQKLPRVAGAINVNAAVVSVLTHDLLELCHGSNACAVAYDEKGVKISTANTAQYDYAALVPLVSDAVTKLNLFAGGATNGSTARNDASAVIQPTFKTGAATDTDSGRSLGFAAVIELPSITTVEFYLGLAGATMAAVATGTSTTKTYTIPADGFGFYFNPADSANWYGYTQSGSDVDTGLDLKVPVAANTRYLLEAYLDANRYANFYINGAWVGKNRVPVDAATLLAPLLSLKTTAGSSFQRHVYVESPLYLTSGNING